VFLLLIDGVLTVVIGAEISFILFTFCFYVFSTSTKVTTCIYIIGTATSVAN